MDKWAKPVDVISYGELTTFQTRKMAKDFFFECMCGTDGSEKEGYSNIVIGLESTNDNMVHDGGFGEANPLVYSIGEFKGTHIEVVKKLEKPMPYKNYLRDTDQTGT